MLTDLTYMHCWLKFGNSLEQIYLNKRNYTFCSPQRPKYRDLKMVLRNQKIVLKEAKIVFKKPKPERLDMQINQINHFISII